MSLPFELPEALIQLPPPVPASRARSRGAQRFHDPKEPYAIWRAAAEPLVRRAWPRGPILGPVSLDIAFIFARPEKRPSWCPPEVWSTGRRFRMSVLPDLDNLTKAVMDALQTPRELRKVPGAVGYPLRDDGAVAAGVTEKWIASATEQARTVARVKALRWVE